MNENTQEVLIDDDMIQVITKSYDHGWNEAVETLIEALGLMDKRIQIEDLLPVLPLMIRKDEDEASS